ncbi:MAG: hypothetical protein NBKEAIPA_03114 [Nitrospirae bacterium]|nr:MAG: hypothetical protein UZ03_NOB001003395 [Nitrospira sp. OLB3]MBV6471182.1 hypothetical protein [Nitrospirota bacterium]
MLPGRGFDAGEEHAEKTHHQCGTRTYHCLVGLTAVVPNEIVDIFAAAGLKKPDLRMLSERVLNKPLQILLGKWLRVQPVSSTNS